MKQFLQLVRVEVWICQFLTWTQNVTSTWLLQSALDFKGLNTGIFWSAERRSQDLSLKTMIYTSITRIHLVFLSLVHDGHCIVRVSIMASKVNRKKNSNCVFSATVKLIWLCLFPPAFIFLDTIPTVFAWCEHLNVGPTGQSQRISLGTGPRVHQRHITDVKLVVPIFLHDGRLDPRQRFHRAVVLVVASFFVSK